MKSSRLSIINSSSLKRLFEPSGPSFIFIIAVVTAMMGCHQRLHYHHFLAVDNTCWSVTDTLHFAPVEVAQDGLYTITAGVRFRDSYPYRDLWLVVEQRSLDMAQMPHRDTVHVILSDRKGQWLTQGVVLHTTEDVVAATRLYKEHAYEFLVYHIMADQNLAGVSDIGLKIE